jgi:hypothetical protein
MVYMHAELQKATNNFAEKSVIGRGGFGMVFEGEIRIVVWRLKTD